MTEATNYFQSMFMFRSFSTVNVSKSLSKSENRLARALVKEGRAFAEVAAREAENGKTALSLAVQEQNKKLSQNLATIALWHYSRSAGKYRQAVESYEQAAKIWPRTKRQKLMKFGAKEMAERALRAESAVKFLNDFLSQS